MHATHLTDADLRRPRPHGDRRLLLPDHRARPRRRHRTGAALLAGAGLFSLGSDSHAVIDLFEEARATELDERLARRERGIITADRLLEAATLDGQHALGWSDAGRLRVGARADLVAVDLESIRTAGGGATAETAVFAAAAADVIW